MLRCKLRALCFSHISMAIETTEVGSEKKNLLFAEFTNSRQNPETIIFLSNAERKLEICEILAMQKRYNAILL